MRMLYLYRGKNSGTNQAVLDSWQINSPEVEIKPYDLSSKYLNTLPNKLMALPLAIRRGGLKAALPGGGRFIDAVKRSSWCMNAISKQVEILQNSQDHDFSLAITTLVPNLKPVKPFFIYTDLTIRANEYYPGGEKQVDLWKECISIEEQSVKNATMVFTMSDHVTRSLIEQYGLSQEKILRVNCGINSPVSEQYDSSRYERKNILFVGIDWERKGGPQLVEAFRKVHDLYPDATLTIVGCSPGISGPGIEIAGQIPPNELSKYFAKASCYCMVSLREAFGIAYIEAMHAGLPVIASSFGAAPDFVINNETGFLVNPQDTDTLADRLIEIISNPEKCRYMGEQAKKLAQSEYTWEKTQQKMYQAMKNKLYD